MNFISQNPDGSLTLNRSTPIFQNMEFRIESLSTKEINEELNPILILPCIPYFYPNFLSNEQNQLGNHQNIRRYYL